MDLPKGRDTAPCARNGGRDTQDEPGFFGHVPLALRQGVVEACGVEHAEAPLLQRQSVGGGNTLADPTRQRTEPVLQWAQQQGLAFLTALLLALLQLPAP
jgi:hypothetical protein